MSELDRLVEEETQSKLPNVPKMDVPSNIEFPNVPVTDPNAIKQEPSKQSVPEKQLNEPILA